MLWDYQLPLKDLSMKYQLFPFLAWGFNFTPICEHFLILNRFSLAFIGWGTEESSDDLKLTQIDVAIRSKQFCNFKLNKTKHEGSRQTFLRIDFFLPDLLKETQFCADSTTLTQDIRTINGDSGGPSVQRFIIKYFPQI